MHTHTHSLFCHSLFHNLMTSVCTYWKHKMSYLSDPTCPQIYFIPQIGHLGMFLYYFSPAVHTLAVMHEVRGHFKGKADRIASGDSIYYSHLIILAGRRKVSSPRVIQHRYASQRVTVTITYCCYVHHFLHKSNCQFWLVLANTFLVQ